MKKSILAAPIFLTIGAIMTGCGKSPEAIVNDAYKAASEKKIEEIAAYILPDSIAPFNEDELKNFAELAWLLDGYTSYTVDSVVTNADETEAKFYVQTTFKDGRSYNETGTLRKTESGKWRLLADKEATDKENVYSESDPTKKTPELMRNLNYASVMTLATRGLPQYQVKAAQIYKDGVFISINDERAMELLQSAADKNYVPAYMPLAKMYEKGGKKVNKDLEKAFEWYLKAAEAGDVNAYSHVANAYRDGDGTMKDFDKAKEWYEKGCEKNNARCLSGLAYMYDASTKGYENNPEKVFELDNLAYKAAQEAGDTEQEATSAGNIGYDYINGVGVAKDAEKAIEWYTKAANLGDENSMRNLGITYYYGQGIPKDYDKAFYWFSKGAKQNNLECECMVAECYEYGRGVDMNKSKASSMYTTLWRDKNYKPAAKGMDRLYNY